MSNVKIKRKAYIHPVSPPETFRVVPRAPKRLMPYCLVIAPHLTRSQNPSHVAKKKKKSWFMSHYLYVSSHALLLRVLSFYLKSWYARQRSVIILCFRGRYTLCYASPTGITERERREDSVVFFNWMYTIVTTNHCFFCFKFVQYLENVVPLSPLCQTHHNVSQPFFFFFFNFPFETIDWVSLKTNVFRVGVMEALHTVRCFIFVFSEFISWEPPSPLLLFVQCLNQIKHLWWSVSKFTCRSQRKVPEIDGGRNWGKIS